MNTLQKKKLRGTGVNCGLIVLLFAVVLLLGQVLPDNTYRRVLVPIIWQMCIFILLGTSLNLTLGYLGQLTLGHMGFAGIGAYTAALSSLALERAGVFEASKAAPGQLILVVLGCCLLGAVFAGLLGLLVGIPALRLRGDYLAIVTLGFGLIVENVIANLPFAGGDGHGQLLALCQRPRAVDLAAGKVCVARAGHHRFVHRAHVHIHPLQIRPRHRGHPRR